MIGNKKHLETIAELQQQLINKAPELITSIDDLERIAQLLQNYRLESISIGAITIKTTAYTYMKDVQIEAQRALETTRKEQEEKDKSIGRKANDGALKGFTDDELFGSV